MAHCILIAEDDPNDVYLFEWVLRATGQNPRLHVVRNGQEAIDYLAGCLAPPDQVSCGIPDLFFLDLKMPLVTGFEVLAWLRQQPALPPIPVVVLSGSNLPSDVQQAIELGANWYVEKPIRPDTLRELLARSKDELLHARPVVPRNAHP